VMTLEFILLSLLCCFVAFAGFVCDLKVCFAALLLVCGLKVCFCGLRSFVVGSVIIF